MSVRAYLSNISPRWTFERQEALLAEAVPGYPKGVAVFRDNLDARTRRHHDPRALADRTEATRETANRRRDETLLVPSPAVFAWSMGDMIATLARAAARGATVRFLDCGLTITPASGAADMEKIAEAFAAARKASFGVPGSVASVEARNARVEAGLDRIRARYHLPTKNVSWAVLQADSGLSRNTIQDRLGNRRILQAKHKSRTEAAAKRAATIAAKRQK